MRRLWRRSSGIWGDGVRFKRGKRYGLPYEKQGLIYFTCLNYKDLPKKQREKIDRLCEKIGGQHRRALLEAVTTEKTMLQVAMEYKVDESWLYRLVCRFFRAY